MNYLDQIAWDIYLLTADQDDNTIRAPTEDDMVLYRIYAVLAKAKGTATTAEDVHDAWSAWMAAKTPDHRSLIPFANLTGQVQQYDDEYVAAIHAVSVRL